MSSTIAVVATTMVIIALKAFDIVYVMTNGNFDTEVIANRMYKEMFNVRDFGRASAIAVVLLARDRAGHAGSTSARFRDQEATLLMAHSRGRASSPRRDAAAWRYQLRPAAAPRSRSADLRLVWMVPTVGPAGLLLPPAHLVAPAPAGGPRLSPPFQFTLENYERVLTTNNMADELRQQPVRDDPGHRHSDPDRRLRRLRLRLDALPRPRPALPGGRRRCWSCRCR